ncbi:hypothetical protein [Deinococcus sonorensis]|uniref:Uncharacterized protein n=2 Tax=Deinococcus sonorensis TaxID=309891 RepID=A0AAU7U7Q4_9DEIO
MKHLALGLLLVAASAHALQITLAPRPAHGEVIVEVQLQDGGRVSPEETLLMGFRDLRELESRAWKTPVPGYTSSACPRDAPVVRACFSGFSIPDSETSTGRPGSTGESPPLQFPWYAIQQQGRNTVQLMWELRPLGGSLLSVRLSATASDSHVNVRQLENRYLALFLGLPGIRLVSHGR